MAETEPLKEEAVPHTKKPSGLKVEDKMVWKNLNCKTTTLSTQPSTSIQHLQMFTVVNVSCIYNCEWKHEEQWLPFWLMVTTTTKNNEMPISLYLYFFLALSLPLSLSLSLSLSIFFPSSSYDFFGNQFTKLSYFVQNFRKNLI